MTGRLIYVRFPDLTAFETEYETNLRHGGMLVKDAIDFHDGEACKVILVHPSNRRELRLTCTVVWVGSGATPPGVGIAISDFTPETRKTIESFVYQSEEPPRQLSLHERLRNLSGPEQIKVAQSGDVSARIVLEKQYGKMVWEPILRNVRVTVPEVARIAQKGGLPQHLFELIGANMAWLRVPQIRRALLGNFKTPAHIVEKLLKTTPRAELKRIANQPGFPTAVRDKAKRLMHQG